MTKKTIVLFVLCLTMFLLTMPSGYTQTKKPLPVKAYPKSLIVKASTTDIELGKQLMSKSDCKVCHKLDIKLIGPSFLEVSKKYPGTASDYAYLADKIIKGGGGVWGQIAMSPHATIPIADAKRIVAYILSVR